MGWMTQDANVAADPPHTKGSALLTKELGAIVFLLYDIYLNSM
jgi:hypothetical protein